MKKSQKILWHILLWLLVFIPIPVALIIIFEQNLGKMKQMMPDMHYNLHEMIWSWIIALINFLIVFYVFYFIIHNLLKRGHINWKNILLTVSIFAVLVIQKWFWDFLPPLNIKGLTFAQRFASITISFCVFTIIITLIQGCIALGFKTILAYFDEKRKRKELETTNLKNELTMLRSQVNPHFIFNTLNNIDALINKDPGKASELLIKLSDEMRYMLYDANIEKIDIESELKFLNNYIALQKIRINQKNPIIVNIEVDNQQEKIPPMLFLPLVENAFKHGDFLKIDDTIKLTIRLKEHILDFSITNPYSQNITFVNSHKGLGLDLVKRRLGLVFPNKHRFEIKNDGLYFTVEFSIKLDEA
jgi:two-component system, LytTR family, sensor kinase